MIKFLIGSISVISVYIIFSVGLGWLWKIGSFENSENINQVLINLSYSYIAGLIFYLLTSTIPRYFTKQKITPIVDRKINEIYENIESCIQSFKKTEMKDLIISSNIDTITQMIESENILGKSYFSQMMLTDITNLEFIKSKKEIIYDLISDILSYKEYLSDEQLTNLENIRSSETFHLLKMSHHPLSEKIYSSKEFEEKFAFNLNNIIESIKAVK